MKLEVAELGSPIGEVVVVAHDGRVCAVAFRDIWPRLRRRLERRCGALTLVRSPDPAGAVGALRAYFAGDVHALDGLPVDAAGTPFQQRVWSRLRRVAVGRTTSYSALAAAAGVPHAVRAVGAANGANPIALVIPCHRVIGADGSLTGYAGGLERKRWLLAHEGVRLAAAPSPHDEVRVPH